MAIPFLFNPLGTGGKIIEDGTEEHPFLIRDVLDFIVFRNAISNGETFTDVHHKLMSDIDLTGVTFVPQTGTENYQGNFDGNFKVVHNFSCSHFNTGSGGFFILVSGSIRNLGLENIYIDNKAGTTNYGNGGLTANIGTNGLIENCYATGTILPPNGRTGGIAGYNNGMIKNCWTNVFVDGTEKSTARIGGIFGDGNGKTENCIALGNIKSLNTYHAGIASYPMANIVQNCVAAMNIIDVPSSSSSGRVNGGNIVGINNYALDTMLLKGAIVANGTTTSPHGANATISQLKSKSFYRDVLGWDMENVWEIDDGNGFPTLKGFK